MAVDPIRAGSVCEIGPRGGVTPSKGHTHYGSYDLCLFLLDPSVVLLPYSSQVVLHRVPGSAPQPILGLWARPSPECPQAVAQDHRGNSFPLSTYPAPHVTCTRLATCACLLQSQSGSFPRLLRGPHLFFTDVKGSRIYRWPKG